jgi:hypothetical protein
MVDAMNVLCGNGPPPVWLHMLRGLSLCDGPYPFASADSTAIAQNHAGAPSRGTPPQSPLVMAQRIGGRNTPARWTVPQPQLVLAAG